MNLHQLLLKNRTIRKYKQEVVPSEMIQSLLENVRLAGCANNLQTLRYIVIESKEKVAGMQSLVHWAARLKGAGNPLPEELPTAFIVIVQTKQMPFSDIDVGMAAEIITQSATEQGLGSCIFGSHNPQEVGEYVHLQEGEKARLVISLGYPAHSSQVVDYKGDTLYYMDENKDFFIPKKSVKDLTEYQ